MISACLFSEKYNKIETVFPVMLFVSYPCSCVHCTMLQTNRLCIEKRIKTVTFCLFIFCCCFTVFVLCFKHLSWLLISMLFVPVKDRIAFKCQGLNFCTAQWWVHFFPCHRISRSKWNDKKKMEKRTRRGNEMSFGYLTIVIHIRWIKK